MVIKFTQKTHEESTIVIATIIIIVVLTLNQHCDRHTVDIQ